MILESTLYRLLKRNPTHLPRFNKVIKVRSKKKYSYMCLCIIWDHFYRIPKKILYLLPNIDKEDLVKEILHCYCENKHYRCCENYLLNSIICKSDGYHKYILNMLEYLIRDAGLDINKIDVYHIYGGIAFKKPYFKKFIELLKKYHYNFMSLTSKINIIYLKLAIHHVSIWNLLIKNDEFYSKVRQLFKNVSITTCYDPKKYTLPYLNYRITPISQQLPIDKIILKLKNIPIVNIYTILYGDCYVYSK